MRQRAISRGSQLISRTAGRPRSAQGHPISNDIGPIFARYLPIFAQYFPDLARYVPDICVIFARYCRYRTFSPARFWPLDICTGDKSPFYPVSRGRLNKICAFLPPSPYILVVSIVCRCRYSSGSDQSLFLFFTYLLYYNVNKLSILSIVDRPLSTRPFLLSCSQYAFYLLASNSTTAAV